MEDVNEKDIVLSSDRYHGGRSAGRLRTENADRHGKYSAGGKKPYRRRPLSQPEASGTTGSGTAGAGWAVTLTAWHDNDEAMMNALADVVNEALAGKYHPEI
ncbi:MAG: hypothetical protein ACLVLH_27965 [Eisenbergiella massiliensis]